MLPDYNTKKQQQQQRNMKYRTHNTITFLQNVNIYQLPLNQRLNPCLINTNAAIVNKIWILMQYKRDIWLNIKRTLDTIICIRK
jgi:hypothetical protein